MNDILFNITLGLSAALAPENLIYCAIGVTLGTLVGVMPGIGALAAISMLFPITFHLEALPALVMLAGLYYGTVYGSSTAAILLNVPGTPVSAVTCLDGYPMAQQGRAGVALGMTTVASFFGASVGIVIMMVLSPLIIQFARNFGAAEYFSLMILGLIAASVISTDSPAKGMAMVVVGMLLGVVGMDVYTGSLRFTFGKLELMDGLSLVALAMGLFGIPEVVASIKSPGINKIGRKITFRSMLPTRDDVRRSWGPMVRGSGIGSFFGALPGTGGIVAAFVSYAVEVKVAKDPSRFGKGAIEGIMGPESANNAADQTAFIPTMTLGIPGNAPMALMLGVLIIHGIAPGPMMMAEQPQIFWGLVMSFWIGNILLLLLNLPLIGLWVRILTIPYHILYPAILMFICIGVFSVKNATFDIFTVIIFGILGYTMRVLAFPAAPLLLGFVLGPMLEENFRRAMLLSRGSFDIFYTRPLSLTFMMITVALLTWTAWLAIRRVLERNSMAVE